MITMIFGLFLFLFSLLGIAVCGVLKLHSSEEQAINPTLVNSHHSVLAANETHYTTTLEIDSKSILRNDTDNNSSSVMASDSSNVFSLSVKVYFAIIVFMFLDISLELFNSITRVFVLECLPPANHRNVLLLITAIGSASGMAFAFMCTFDLSSMLESLFDYDGTSLLVVFLPTLLAFMITVTFVCTMVTGYFLRGSRSKGTPLPDEMDVSPNRGTSDGKEQLESQSRDSLGNGEQTGLVGANPTGGGLKETTHYQAFERGTAGRQTEQPHTENDFTRTPGGCSRDQNEGSGEVGNHFCLDQEMRGSDQQFTRQLHSSSEKVNDTPAADAAGPKPGIRPRRWALDLRYVIVFIAMFFVAGSMECVQIYMPNAVTRDIYHGDPTAPPDTEARTNYDTGLRRAATGSLIMFICFTVGSLGIKKFVHIISEDILFLVIQLIFIAGVLSVLLARTEVTFFLAMAANGLLRICTHVIMYLKISLIMQTRENASDGKSSPKTGTAMSTVYLCKPIHYLVLSTMMGPLLDVTANVWVPIIYALVSCCLALLTYPLLFLVKAP